ncbi:MAG: CBS domain-containing protein [Chloroflexi bacterium]|nr:CBS domain-containing protein [Chloroflexota bacterium]
MQQSSYLTALSAKWGYFLDRWQPPVEAIFWGTALIVGLATGLGAVLVTYLIRSINWVGYQWIPAALDGGKWYVVLVPAFGGLVAGALIYKWAAEAKGHGVPEVMEAMALRGGRIRPIVAVIKILASSFTIGSGGSAGREGPIVQIGAGLGSTLGQVLNLSDDRVKNLVACGAAAGIAATFNAPIAGVIFALEVIIGRFTTRYFASVVVSAVAAAVVGRIAFGDHPAFAVPTEYGVASLWDFVFYSMLGVLAAVVGVAFTRSLYATEDLFDNWKRAPEWLKPAIGGMLLGVLALVYPLVTHLNWDDHTPEIFGVGYAIIEAALAGRTLLTAAIFLLLLKLVATSLTLGSGGSGGVFAPGLFMGAMLGVAFQQSMAHFFPNAIGPTGAFALVGMAAVFSAAAHAPITAVLMLFELTGDYRIILPLMLTVVIATLLSQRMMNGESIYTLKLTRRGIRIREGRDVDIMQSVTVGEVMTTDVATVPTNMTLPELADVFARTRHHGLMVLDREGNLWGIVTVTDLDRAIREDRPRSTTVAEIATPYERLRFAYPDEPMGDALARMANRGLGRMPVVAREDPRRLLGVIRRSDIVEAYRLARTRRAELQYRAQRVQRKSPDGTEFIELPLREGDAAVGKTLAEVAKDLPKDCVCVSIRRDGRVIIPHGDTVFQPGDSVTAFVSARDVEKLFHAMYGDRAVGAIREAA